MKLYIYPLCALLLASPGLYAKDFSGHRVGIGMVDSGYLPKNVVLVEYGYEFNRIIGVNISGSSYEEDYYEGWLKYDGTYARISSDIGYTFDFNGWDLKPYALLGMIHLNESNTLSNSSTTEVQYGGGVRATLDFGGYLDLSFKAMDLEGRDGNESSLTIGYKF
ncbi:outer membrane beta-barrel protein [Psychromonas aquimarina]|uniref:outer membrane beta-barrel protein n=1 Tax=Psychromonas aquimarina TaxID=444919 RepID=UPI0003F85660|nr:outer membrane beta-barrel protein [Psychromonas aquimarina]